MKMKLTGQWHKTLMSKKTSMQTPTQTQMNSSPLHKQHKCQKRLLLMQLNNIQMHTHLCMETTILMQTSSYLQSKKCNLHRR